MWLICLQVLTSESISAFKLKLNYLFGEGNGNPRQYSCLENPMDRGAWQAMVHGVVESDTTEATKHARKLSQLAPSPRWAGVEARKVVEARAHFWMTLSQCPNNAG